MGQIEAKVNGFISNKNVDNPATEIRASQAQEPRQTKGVGGG